MFNDYFRRVYRLFVPEPGPERKEDQQKLPPRRSSSGEYVPIYENDKIIAYRFIPRDEIQRKSSKESLATTELTLEQLITVVNRVITSKSNGAVESKGNTLPPPGPEPRAHDPGPSIQAVDIEDIVERVTDRLTSRVLGLVPPNPAPAQPDSKPTAVPDARPPLPESSSNLEIRLNWFGLPDGDVMRTFTHEERALMGKQFLLHWAHRASGNGRAAKKGNRNSPTLAGGHVLNYSCLGIFQCENEDCGIAVRPQADPNKRSAQMESLCPGRNSQRPCGFPLKYHPCSGTSASMTEWSGGFTFIHRGYHGHNPPTRPLHAAPDARRDFAKTVITHPGAGPRELMQGPQELGGPGQSVADLDPVYENVHRVGRFRKEVIQSQIGSGGDDFIELLANFEKENPGFIVAKQIGTVTVISMQTPFMASNLVSEEFHEDPVNGINNDAAHGFWTKRTSLLMVSSSFCPEIKAWVPALWSYTNGASAEHFKSHFLALFNSIASEALNKDIDIADRLFASLMDFSDAESKGYTEAFVSFWLSRADNYRSEKELRIIAPTLLRGCAEHFRASVTRIKRNGAVVPPDQQDEFQSRALSLIEAENIELFRKRAVQLTQDFPNCYNWMVWWLREQHASMLFQSVRRMDPAIWDSIPSTTNAQESLHWVSYAHCGRNHRMFPGFKQLRRLADTFERRYFASEAGLRIEWGNRRPHVRLAQDDEEVQQSAREKKDEMGRPPDTTKELVGKQAQSVLKQQNGSKQLILDFSTLPAPPSKVSKKKKAQVALVFPSWRWNSNSCYLDSSLELLYSAAHLDFADFVVTFGNLDPDNLLARLFQCLNERRIAESDLELTDPKLAFRLNWLRDNLRTQLVEKGIIGKNTAEPLWGWLWRLVRDSAAGGYNTACSYFDMLMSDIHRCSGCDETNGQHMQIVSPALRRWEHQLSQTDFTRYNGRVLDWFRDLISLKTRFQIQSSGCFRLNGTCTGTRSDIRNIVLSIPAILIIETEDLVSSDHSWNFPPTLMPANKQLADNSGLIYDLVGLAFFREPQTPEDIGHFSARFASRDRTVVYNYDGFLHDGFVTEETGGKFSTCIAGGNVPTPKGFRVTSAVYHLRGGTKAQLEFLEYRKKELQRKLHLSVNQENLTQHLTLSYLEKNYEELDPTKCSWKVRKNHVEYILSNPAPDSKSRPQPRSQSTTTQKGSHPRKNVTSSKTSSAKNIKQDELAALSSDSEPESEDDNEGELQLILNDDAESTASSAPTSLWEMKCRCGRIGDGNEMYDLEIEGEAIQCDECQAWSHQACQKDGLSSLLTKNQKFRCAACTFEDLRAIKKNGPGIGALARNGTYYYPVRLIFHVVDDEHDKWSVLWWRSCQFEPGSDIEPGTVTTVPSTDIVDGLWRNCEARRSIRLGQWIHAQDEPSTEDILSNPDSVPYTPDIDNILAPWTSLLRALMMNPSQIREKVPVLQWLQNEGKTTYEGKRGIVPYVGNLRVRERAKINNWFDIKVGEQKRTNRNKWLGKAPVAHAITIYLAYFEKIAAEETRELTEGEKQLEAWLDEAWEFQRDDRNIVNPSADPDLECLDRLERQMFEHSKAAGVAGSMQWGLDAGDHQERWNPYLGLPTEWNLGDREDSENEYLRGPHYIELPIPEDARNHAKPKPKARATRQSQKKK